MLPQLSSNWKRMAFRCRCQCSFTPMLLYFKADQNQLYTFQTVCQLVSNKHKLSAHWRTCIVSCCCLKWDYSWAFQRKYIPRLQQVMDLYCFLGRLKVFHASKNVPTETPTQCLLNPSWRVKGRSRVVTHQQGCLVSVEWRWRRDRGISCTAQTSAPVFWWVKV